MEANSLTDVLGQFDEILKKPVGALADWERRLAADVFNGPARDSRPFNTTRTLIDEPSGQTGFLFGIQLCEVGYLGPIGNRVDSTSTR